MDAIKQSENRQKNKQKNEQKNYKNGGKQRKREVLLSGKIKHDLGVMNFAEVAFVTKQKRS